MNPQRLHSVCTASNWAQHFNYLNRFSASSHIYWGYKTRAMRRSPFLTLIFENKCMIKLANLY